MACFPGSTDQLVGYCNKIGANYNHSRRSVVGNIPGCSFFGSKRGKGNPPWGPGLPAEMVSVGPMSPRPDSAPQIACSHGRSPLFEGCPRPARQPRTPACGLQPKDPQHEPHSAFLLLPSASWLTAAAAVHTRQSVNGQRGISKPIIAPPRCVRTCVRAGTDFLLVLLFLQAGCSADRRYARRSHYYLPEARVMRQV